MNNQILNNKLVRIEFCSGAGEFFTSKYARYQSVADLEFDLIPYFKRFPEHTATWSFAIE